MSGLRYYLVYTVAIAVVVACFLGGAWSFLPLLLVFGLLPLLDREASDDGEAADGGAAPSLLLRLALWLVVPVHAVVLGCALYAVTTRDLLWWEWAGLALSVGAWSGGAGITVAHELIHRRRFAERAAGELLMTSVCYPHFCVEHVAGHHRNVATPTDPATARLGESFYAFLPRCVVGSVRSAWHLEGTRVRKRGRGFLGLGDARLRQPLFLGALITAVALLGGAGTIGFFFVQAAVAIVLLEVVNYVEHYGLVRRELEPGKYEPVRAAHSWDSNHRLSNWYLFHLPRHAHHHQSAHQPFHSLTALPGSPQLPAGYPAMTLAALCPPLWRRLMDPRVSEWHTATAAVR